jgi:cytochrome c-type biogenesis protein CcmF
MLALLIGLGGTFWLSAHYQQDFKWTAFVTLVLSLWLTFSTLAHCIGKSRNQQGFIAGAKKLSLSYWGMCIAHTGIAVTALGIGLTTIYEEQRDVRMLIGDTASLAPYNYQLTAIETVPGPNYQSTRATVNIYSQKDAEQTSGKLIAVLQPEKRFYYAARNVMTEAAIDPGLSRDLYIALGEDLGDGAWAVRMHIKPFVRCIWLGCLMMAFGGILAVFDKRYRKLAVQSAASKTKNATSNLFTQNPANGNLALEQNAQGER